MREKGGGIVLLEFSAVTTRAPAREAADAAATTGNPMCMPPEAFRNEDSGTVGDIYGLGVVLCRLVSAAFPIDRCRPG